jgi:hypothetical protein
MARGHDVAGLMGTTPAQGPKVIHGVLSLRAAIATDGLSVGVEMLSLNR